MRIEQTKARMVLVSDSRESAMLTPTEYMVIYVRTTPLSTICLQLQFPLNTRIILYMYRGIHQNKKICKFFTSITFGNCSSLVKNDNNAGNITLEIILSNLTTKVSSLSGWVTT